MKISPSAGEQINVRMYLGTLHRNLCHRAGGKMGTTVVWGALENSYPDDQKIYPIQISHSVGSSRKHPFLLFILYSPGFFF